MYDPLHSSLADYDDKFPCDLEPRKFKPRQRVKVENYRIPMSLSHDLTVLGVIVAFEDGRNLGRHYPSYRGWVYHVKIESQDDLILIGEEELEAV